MDFTHPINAAEPPPKKRGKWLRKWVIGLLVLVVALIGLVVATPTILSMTWARTWALERLNAAVAPARVTAEAWSLSWFGEQQIEGITYCDETKGIRSTVKRVRLGSLWQLLPMGKMSVEVAVETPEVFLTSVPTETAPVPPPTTPPATAPSAPKKMVLPAWDLSARVMVTEASVHWDALPEPLLSKGRLEVNLPALDKELTVTFSGQALDATTTAEATLSPIERLLEAKVAADILRTARMSFAAPWATLSANVDMPPEAALPLCQTTMTLRLAPLLARLQTLKVAVPEGLEAVSGNVILSAALAPSKIKGQQTATLDLSSNDVALTYEGKTLRLSPRLGFALSVDPNAPLKATLERLSLDFPGLMAAGKGSLAEGTLAAELDVNRLLETFRPFLGELSLADALSLRLDARAKDGTFGLDVKATSRTQTIADVTLSAEGIDLENRSVRSAKLNLKAILEEALRFAPPLPNGQRLKGTLWVNAAGAGAFEDFKGKALLAVRDLTYRSASWKVEEPSLLEAETDFRGWNERNAPNPGWCFTLTHLKLTSPVFSAQGDVTYRLRPGHLTLDLSGTAQPGTVLARWRTWGKDETPMSLTGGTDYAIQLSYAPASREGTGQLRLKSTDFAMTLPPYRAFPLPITLEATASLDETTAELKSLTLETPYLGLQANGTLVENLAKLQGELTPDFTAIFLDLPFFDTLRKHVAITGRHSRPFAFEAPINAGAAGFLNYGKGSAEVVFDRITVPGFDIPNGTAKVALDKGIAALDGVLTVNGGTLRLSPRIALGAKPYTITLPDDSQVLEGVALTQQLLDTALKYVNPMLPGSASPQGTLDLVCNRFTLPLGDVPLKDLETQFSLRTHACGVRPNGLLGTVLGLVRMADKAAILPDQDFSVRIAEGTLTCDPIRMRIAAIKLDCSGSTNLMTRELDYTLSLPLTQQLLGDRLSKHLRVGEVLRLPIRGTTDRPILDTEPLVNTLANSALGQATERLTERLGKALKKGGEAGMDAGSALGDAAGDVIRATGRGGAEAGEQLGDALRSLFNRKKKND